MSERPRFNPASEALDNFEADKQAHDEQVAREWVNNHREAALDELGSERFSAEDRQVLEDLIPVSEAHDRLAERAEAESFEESLRQEARENGGVLSYNDHDDPDTMTEAESERRRQQEREVMDKAYDDLIAADPELRRMDMLSREIEGLRNKEVDADTVDQDERMLFAKEDKLSELLAKYEASPHFSAAIADYLMDREDDKAHEEAGLEALFELRRRATAPGETGDKGTRVPTVETGEEGTPVPTVETGEEGTIVPTVETGEEGTPVPTVETGSEGEEGTTVPTVETGGEGTSVPTVETDTPPAEERGWFGRTRERIRDRRRMRNIVLGAAALTAVGVGIWALLTQKDSTILNNALGGDVPPSPPELPLGGDVPAGGIDLGTNPGDTLPPSSEFDYPWNWASEAVGSDNATTWLHELSDKAAADGHKVEWFTQADGTEWVKVDGNSTTKDVIDVLRQYNK